MGRHADAVTRTFRINRMSLDVLEAEAEKESLSASALLNKILQKYVETSLWGDKDNFINLPNASFVKFLKTLSEEEAYNLGVESAKGEKENIINFMWKGKTIDEFLQFIDRNYGVYSGWFRCNHQCNDNKHIVVAHHNLDIKWSHFIAGYIQTLFQGVHKIELEYKISDNSVAFTFET
jgi:hypothetical protein